MLRSRGGSPAIIDIFFRVRAYIQRMPITEQVNCDAIANREDPNTRLSSFSR